MKTTKIEKAKIINEKNKNNIDEWDELQKDLIFEDYFN